MGETFMSAITQIEELINKKKQIIERAASLISEAIIDRIKSGNMSRATEKDIKNSIKNFSLEEQVEILSRAIVFVGMNNKTNNYSDDDNGYRSNSGKKVKSRSDLFGKRFDD